jgi:hypothetical protein
VSLDSNNGVFRRYHVDNNPVNWIDPFGLFSWHDLIPTNPRKVIVGIGFQFVAYVLAAPQVAVVWEEGPIGLFEPGMIKRSGVIGFTWLQGTKLIYQGYSETPCKSR